MLNFFFVKLRQCQNQNLFYSSFFTWLSFHQTLLRLIFQFEENKGRQSNSYFTQKLLYIIEPRYIHSRSIANLYLYLHLLLITSTYIHIMATKRGRGEGDMKKKMARLRFKNLVRSVTLNRIWLMDSGEQKLSLNVKKNINMLIRPQRKVGVLTMAVSTKICVSGFVFTNLAFTDYFLI